MTVPLRQNYRLDIPLGEEGSESALKYQRTTKLSRTRKATIVLNRDSDSLFHQSRFISTKKHSLNYENFNQGLRLTTQSTNIYLNQGALTKQGKF